jgi:hypothetical protein
MNTLIIVFASLCGVGAIGVTYSVYRCLTDWTSEPSTVLRRRGDIELNEIPLINNDVNWNDILPYPPSAHIESTTQVYDIINSGLDFSTILELIVIIIKFINNLF